MKNLVTKYRITVILFALLLVVVVFSVIEVKEIEDIVRDDLVIVIDSEEQVIAGNDMTIYKKDEIIEGDLLAYFYNADPVLVITPTLSLSRDIATDLSVTAVTTIDIRAVDGDRNNYWIEVVEKVNYPVLSLGNEALVLPEIELDIYEYYLESTVIREDFGSSVGILEVNVVTTYVIEGVVDGENIRRTLVDFTNIGVHSEFFNVSESKSVNVVLLESIEETSFLYKLLTYEIVYVYLIVLYLIGIIISVWYKNRQRNTEYREHRKFRDWITDGTIDISDKTLVDIVKLSGLVDLAIDLDKRVIYDSNINHYFVLAEEVLYRYNPQSNFLSEDMTNKFGKFLLTEKMITMDEYETALFNSRQTYRYLRDVLLELGILNETELYSAMAKMRGYSYIDINYYPIPREVSWTDKLPLKDAKKKHVVPVGNRSDGTQVVATILPMVKGVKDLIYQLFGEKTNIVITTPSNIHNYLHELERTINVNHAVPVRMNGYSVQKENKVVFQHELKNNVFLKGPFLVTIGAISQFEYEEVKKHYRFEQWIISNNDIDDVTKALVNSLARLVNRIENYDDINILTLLLEANFISENEFKWIKEELEITSEDDVKKALIGNCFASDSTIRLAKFIIDKFNELRN